MDDELMSTVIANLSAVSDARDHNERRQWTRDLNRAIGDRTIEPFRPEAMDADMMHSRCLYVAARNEVVITPPAWAEDHGPKLLSLPVGHFVQMYKGNLMAHPTRTVGRGGNERPAMVESAELWLESPMRNMVTDAVYAIGRGRFLRTPQGDSAVNLWTPMKRIRVESDISLFHQHIAFLLPNADDRERFLDWLAHCEQKPQELPHHGWLMWTEAFGIGRNWVASVLTRVWSGEVAPSLDLVALLSGSFNNAISCKRMAVVDEIHIGTNSSLFTMAARLRQLMTEEIRIINPKYGKLTAEFNTTRWLVFSNHDDALPIPEDDRRFEVVKNPSEVQSESYYARLYAALDDPDFIAGIAHFLSTRNINNYDPGKRPRMTDAKRHVIESSTPQLDKDARDTLIQWKANGIKLFCSNDLIKHIGATPQQSAAFHHVIKRLKVEPLGRFKLFGAMERVFAVDRQTADELRSDAAAFEAAKQAIATERLEGGLFHIPEKF